MPRIDVFWHFDIQMKEASSMSFSIDIVNNSQMEKEVKDFKIAVVIQEEFFVQSQKCEVCRDGKIDHRCVSCGWKDS